MSLQLEHKEHSNSQAKFPVIILTDNLMGDANIGSIFRLADAFNIEKIIFCGTPFNPKNSRLKKTARSTLKNVDFEFQENPTETIEKLKELNYVVFALEITSDSEILGSTNFEKESKIVFNLENSVFIRVSSSVKVAMPITPVIQIFFKLLNSSESNSSLAS